MLSWVIRMKKFARPERLRDNCILLKKNPEGRFQRLKSCSPEAREACVERELQEEEGIEGA